MTLKKESQRKDVDIVNLMDLINKDKINVLSRKNYSKFRRYVCFNFLHGCGFTSTAIGLLFDKSGKNGALDHSTVLHGLGKYKELSIYPDFKAIMNEWEPVLDSYIMKDVRETGDIHLNEMISLAYLESEMFKNFPNLATQKIHTLL